MSERDEERDRCVKIVLDFREKAIALGCSFEVRALIEALVGRISVVYDAAATASGESDRLRHRIKEVRIHANIAYASRDWETCRRLDDEADALSVKLMALEMTK